MIEILVGLKSQSADQLDRNFFQDDNKTKKIKSKGKTNRSKNKNKDKLQCNKSQRQKFFDKHLLQTIQI